MSEPRDFDLASRAERLVEQLGDGVVLLRRLQIDAGKLLEEIRAAKAAP